MGLSQVFKVERSYIFLYHKYMLDVLCVGDAKLDIFFQIPNTNPHFGLDKENNKWLISFGEKISVDKYVLDIGGNATNTAVGLSKLGLNVGLMAEIGKDEFSEKILNRFEEEKINTEFLLQTDNEKTSFSVAISYKGDRTLFTEHATRKHDFNFDNLETKFVYLTSLGKEWEKAYEKTLNFAEKNNIKLIFNPGTLQIEKRNPIIWSAISKSNILFVNKEEAEELLYGKEINLPINSQNYVKKLLYGLKSLGAKIVVITDGNTGSYAMDETHSTYQLGIIPCEVVEKTGAGDAYSSGFISAILNGETLQEAMRWGTFNSAAVIGEVGAEKGLLTKDEMLKKLKSNEDFKAKEI